MYINHLNTYEERHEVVDVGVDGNQLLLVIEGLK